MNQMHISSFDEVAAFARQLTMHIMSHGWLAKREYLLGALPLHLQVAICSVLMTRSSGRGERCGREQQALHYSVRLVPSLLPGKDPGFWSHVGSDQKRQMADCAHNPFPPPKKIRICKHQSNYLTNPSQEEPKLSVYGVKNKGKMMICFPVLLSWRKKYACGGGRINRKQQKVWQGIASSFDRKLFFLAPNWCWANQNLCPSPAQPIRMCALLLWTMSTGGRRAF